MFFYDFNYITAKLLKICSVGGNHWSGIIKNHSCVVSDHGNIENQNAAVEPLVIEKLEFHFNKLKDMADINATRTVTEMTGQVTLRHNCDNKVCLPSWISKQCCYQM